MGRASQAAGNFPRAIENFQAYLKEYPERCRSTGGPVSPGRGPAPGRPAAPGPADLDRPGPRPRAAQAGRDRKDAQNIRRQSPSSRFASTFGIPDPPDDTSLNLGVAALRRFLAAYPAHPRAVRAAYEIGASRTWPAARATRRSTAFYRVPQGRRLQGRDRPGPARPGRARHDGHVSVWRRSSRGSRSSTRRSPPGRATWPSSPTGPRAPMPSARILDTQLLIAADHLEPRPVSPRPARPGASSSPRTRSTPACPSSSSRSARAS